MFDALVLNPEVFGLDVSDLSLKIAKLKKKKRSFSLAAFGEAQISPGIVTNGEVVDGKSLAEIIKKSLKGLKGERLNTQYVVASLPEEKSFLQIIQLPKMNEAEIRKAVFFEAENYVPLPIDQVYLDFQIIPPFFGPVDHTDVLIGAIPRIIVDPYLSCLKAAGLKPVAFEIESQAIARSLIKNEASESPVLLIDFGATRTSFIIFSGRSLRFTTSIQISSQVFTEAISRNLKIDAVAAEKLKIDFGLEKKGNSKDGSGSEVFEALVPVLSDLVDQIQKYLEYYHTHVFHDHLPQGHKDVAKIIISGGGANLKGLAEFLSLELKLPVDLADPWINLSHKQKVVQILPAQKSLSFATALGLALRGAKNYD